MTSASGKRASPAKRKPAIQNGSKALPSRSVLMDVAAGKKTINDYAKAGRPINDYPSTNG